MILLAKPLLSPGEWEPAASPISLLLWTSDLRERRDR